MLELLWSGILDGVVTGLIYVLVALGMTMLYSILHIVNFAHGEVYMLGALGVFAFNVLLGLNFALALLMVAILAIPLGMIVERVVFRPVRGKWIQMVVASVGLTLIIQGIGWKVFGIVDKSVPSIFPGVVRILGVSISWERIFAAGVAIVLVAGLYFVVYQTKIGRAMRAMEQDADAARIQGVNTDKISAINVSIGFILAAVAGALTAPIFVVNAGIGLNATLIAFMIIIIGGLGSITGCVLGGLLVAILQSVSAIFLGSELSYGIVFALLIVVIIARPSGLLGSKI